MGRQYTVAHYRERLERIREAVPGIGVSTDVIVGFCGETEEQFQATMSVLEELRFDTVFAAAYSPRPGTPALRMADDVPPAIKRRRLNELLARQEQIGWRSTRDGSAAMSKFSSSGSRRRVATWNPATPMPTTATISSKQPRSRSRRRGRERPAGRPNAPQQARPRRR